MNDYGIECGRKMRKTKERKWLNMIECDMRTTGMCENDVD